MLNAMTKPVIWLYFAIYLLLGVFGAHTQVVHRPVIGILTQPTWEARSASAQYLNSGYVKWIESAGARTIPVPYHLPDDELEKYMKRINGIVLPGGNTDRDTPRFLNAIEFFLKKSMSLKDHNNSTGFPIWGTCLGFQMLHFLVNDKHPDTIVAAEAYDMSLPLDWQYNTEDASQTPDMFSLLSSEERLNMQNYLQKNPSTANVHHYGVGEKEYKQFPKLQQFFRILATSVNPLNKTAVPFVALVEARKYPIYAAQYHPERTAYEWNSKEKMLRSLDNIRAQHYFSAFFVEKARTLNQNSFQSDEEFLRFSIHNYPLTHEAHNIVDEDQGYYFFNLTQFPKFF